MMSSRSMPMAPTNTPLRYGRGEGGIPLRRKRNQFSRARDAKAPDTKRAYQSDWNAFAAFGSARNHVSLPAPADVVALYLPHAAEKQRLKMSTVTRRIAAITEKHRANGFVSPSDEWVVRNTLRRLRRELGAPAHGKARC